MSGIATAIVGTGLLSYKAQDKSSERAVDAQLQSGDAAIGEQQRQFDTLQKVLEPFTKGGTSAFGGLLDLIGVNGQQRAGQAIGQIEESPEFEALNRSSEEAILANASATGGLRGGNVQAALAQNRPQNLSNLISQQVGRLLAASQFGQSSAAGVGSGAIQTGANVSNILRDQGNAIASGALARGNNTANTIGDLGFALTRHLGANQGGIPEMSAIF